MADQDMLINYVPGEECRIAIAEDAKLEELYTERASDELHVGNIYRGKVTNVEPSIQAAFIDFGIDRHGFLHISDLHPRYFNGDDATERVGKRTPRRDRPPIQQCLKRGQNILVQVLKEGIGTKGPTLTSYLSIPGRFLVMMPDMEHSGVSRKVDDDSQRREMRKILDELELPEGFGFIVRTAGLGRTKTELKRDLAYLMRLWKTIDRRLKQGKGPAELYRESDLIIRTLRDVLSNDIKRIIIDDFNAARRARDFMRIAMPRGAAKVYFYDRPIPLLDAFDIERQIAVINEREVPLPSGGSLVIDSTEAMVTVDVNSGKYRDKSDAEATAFHTNCEAVDEIARQLRLRDLGGVVCLDLIDMYQPKNRREIERRFKDHLKKDRARSKTLKINELGLLSLTRQRMRPSLKRSLHEVCPTCDGASVVKTAESVVLDAIRQLAVVLSADNVASLELTITPEVGAVLINRKRAAMHQLEQQLRKPVTIEFDATLSPDDVQIVAYDARGATVDIDKLPRPKKPRFGSDDEVDVAEKRLGVAEPGADAEGTDDAWADYGEWEGKESAEETDPDHADAETEPRSGTGEDQGGSGRKRRRRRRKRKTTSEPQAAETQARDEGETETTDAAAADAQAKAEADAADRSEISVERFEEEGVTDGGDSEEQPPKKKRRRRRGGRKHRRRRDAAQAEGGNASPDDQATEAAPPEGPADAPAPAAESPEPSPGERDAQPDAKTEAPADERPRKKSGSSEPPAEASDEDSPANPVRVFKPGSTPEPEADAADDAPADASVDPDSPTQDTTDQSGGGTTRKTTRSRSSSSGSRSKRTTKKQSKASRTSKKTASSVDAPAASTGDAASGDQDSAGE